MNQVSKSRPEKRDDPRRLKRLPVRFWKRGDDKARSGFTTNISFGGMYIGCNHLLARGTRVRVEVMDPKNGFMIEGVVARMERVPPELRSMRSSGMGIRFLDTEELVGELFPQGTTVKLDADAVGEAARRAEKAAADAKAKADRDQARRDEVRRRAREAAQQGRIGGDTDPYAHLRSMAQPPAQAAQTAAPSGFDAGATQQLPDLNSMIGQMQGHIQAQMGAQSQHAQSQPAQSQQAQSQQAPPAQSADTGTGKIQLPELSPAQRAAASQTRGFAVSFATREALRATFERDIVQGGLFIGTSNPAAVGDRVLIEIRPPAELGPPIRLFAQVVHCFERNTDYGTGSQNLLAGMGVEFTDPEAAQEAIRGLLAE